MIYLLLVVIAINSLPQSLLLNEFSAEISTSTITSVLPHLLSLSENESNVKTDINVNGLPQPIILNESIGKIRLDINTNTIPQYLNFVESVANIFIGSDLTVNVLPQSLAFTESNGAIELPVTIAILPQALNIVESSAVINTSGLRSLKMVLAEITDKIRLLENITTQDKDDIALKTVELGNLDYLEHTVFINTELAPTIGKGTELEPFGVTSDAIDFAESKKFKKLGILYELIIDRQIKNFYIYGIGGVPPVDTNNQNLDKSSFYQVALNGQYTGSIVARDCNLVGNNTTLNGFFNNCAFGSSFKVPNLGTAFVSNSYSLVSGFVKSVYSVGGVDGTGNLIIMGHTGGVTVTDCNKVTDEVKIVSTGIVEIDDSCSLGTIVVLGLIKPIDNSTGATVLWYNMNPEELTDVWDASYNKRDRDTITNIIDLYNRDGVTIKKQFQSDAGYNLVEPI